MGLLRLSWWQINWKYRWTGFLFFRALVLQGLCLYFRLTPVRAFWGLRNLCGQGCDPGMNRHVWLNSPRPTTQFSQRGSGVVQRWLNIGLWNEKIMDLQLGPGRPLLLAGRLQGAYFGEKPAKR